jgi:hypothetical protein
MFAYNRLTSALENLGENVRKWQYVEFWMDYQNDTRKVVIVIVITCILSRSIGYCIPKNRPTRQNTTVDD